MYARKVKMCSKRDREMSENAGTNPEELLLAKARTSDSTELYSITKYKLSLGKGKHHSSNCAGKIHQWIINLVGKNFEEKQDISKVSLLR